MNSDFEALFERARGITTPEARAAFLDEACRGRPELRSRLDRALADAPAADAFFGDAAGDDEETAATPTVVPALAVGGAGSPPKEAGSPGPDLVPGTLLLDRYRIVTLAGAGGMGEVYRADDLRLEVPVALKFLPGVLAGTPRLVEALCNEVRLARRVAHRHVGRVFDIGEWDGRSFLTMEFIEGEDLGSLLRRIGALPARKALDLARQLCAGLEAAHEAGLLHLDLKPANLMIDGRGDLRITDFGLSRLASEAPDGWQRAGTPAYMAPEHLLTGEVSPACDLYAAGLVVLEMFTGRRLHEGRSLEGLADWHRQGRTPDLAGLPPLLRPPIAACLADNPGDRPASATALGDLLAAAAERIEGRPAALAEGPGAHAGAGTHGGKQLAAIMFTDLVDSVALQERLGTESFMRLVDRHDAIFEECLAAVPTARILNETGDGFLVRFTDPADAVATALRLQDQFRSHSPGGIPIVVRIGLHLGVVTEMEERVRGEKRAVGVAINVAARLMDLAAGGQILMSRAVYEDARSFVREHPHSHEGDTADPPAPELPPLRWVSHGFYELKGNPEPVEVLEVGAEGLAPLLPPPDGAKAKRVDGRGGGAAATSPKTADIEVLPPSDLAHTDVVIAYAPIDDMPVTSGKSGWITQFHDHLEVRLAQLSGEPVKIWRDVGERAADPPAEVLELLPRARAMVSVLSPPFVKTPGCLRGFEQFWRSAEREGSFRISNKTRIVKVVKTPVPPGVAPPEIDRLLAELAGVDFYETDPETGRFREYDHAFGERARQRYFERIYDLAYEIRDLLEALGAGKNGGSRGASAGQSPSRTVFLAETTSDLAAERDVLRRELLERGHRVLPARPLPLTGPELEREVTFLLEECDFSVHLAGARYGMVPEDTAESVVEIQNRIAADRSGASGLERLIWMPRAVEPRDERQAAFLRALVEDPGAHAGGEVVQDSIEGFKRLLLDRLAPKTLPPDAAPTRGAPEALTVYLIYEQRDEDEAEALEDILFDLGYEVMTPHFEDDEAEVARVHRHNLLHCDAALVYYGSSSRPWVEMKLMDLRQAPGYGRTRDLLARGVLVAPSEDRRKARFRTHLADVIRPESGVIDAAVLEPFTTRLREAVAGP